MLSKSTITVDKLCATQETGQPTRDCLENALTGSVKPNVKVQSLSVSASLRGNTSYDTRCPSTMEVEGGEGPKTTYWA